MSESKEQIDQMRRFEFWREGCRTFTKNVCVAIALSHDDCSKEHLLRFLEWLPKSPSDLLNEDWKGQYFYYCLKKMYERREQEGARESLDYFITYFVNRSYDAQVMLVDSLVGLITGLDAAEKDLKKGGRPCAVLSTMPLLQWLLRCWRK